MGYPFGYPRCVSSLSGTRYRAQLPFVVSYPPSNLIYLPLPSHFHIHIMGAQPSKPVSAPLQTPLSEKFTMVEAEPAPDYHNRVQMEDVLSLSALSQWEEDLNQVSPCSENQYQSGDETDGRIPHSSCPALSYTTATQSRPSLLDHPSYTMRRSSTSS
jgi:hypothetical protein